MDFGIAFVGAGFGFYLFAIGWAHIIRAIDEKPEPAQEPAAAPEPKE